MPTTRSTSIGHLNATLTSRLASSDIKIEDIKPILITMLKEYPEHRKALISHAVTIRELKISYAAKTNKTQK